jgi:hypothetical protein
MSLFHVPETEDAILKNLASTVLKMFISTSRRVHELSVAPTQPTLGDSLVAKWNIENYLQEGGIKTFK